MKKIRFTTIVVLLLTGFLFSGCSQQVEKKNTPLKVAITKLKSNKYKQTYRDWLHRYNATIQWVNLYPLTVDSALKVLKTCDGLLSTGGGDIYPGLYGKLDQADKCGPSDRHRDSIELAAIHQAVNMKMPVIGICRGLQIINVAMGGSLYTDLPTDIGTKVIHRQKDWRHCFHEVYLRKNSFLYHISRADSGSVASNHHQGIDRLGNGLKVGAHSADSLAEAIEWTDTTGKGFLMAVQWHPERMDTLAPLSKTFAEKFISEMKMYATKKQPKK